MDGIDLRANIKFTTNTHTSIGGRNYNEDRWSVVYQYSADERQLLYAYFAIFDGHGGHHAAAYAKEHLRDNVVSQEAFWSNDDSVILQSIRQGFLNTHLGMRKELENWPTSYAGLPSNSGTTATVAFLRNGKIYAGHVGDSAIAGGYEEPGVLYWKVKTFTKAHKPDDATENARIAKSGGKVTKKSGVLRVVWNRPRTIQGRPIDGFPSSDDIPLLAMTRSLGDLWSYNCETNEFVISPTPDVFVINIDAMLDRCLIIATDGLWDVLKSQEAINSAYFAEKHNKQELPEDDPSYSSSLTTPKTLINPAKRLVDRALDRWAIRNLQADNITVITINFEYQHTKVNQEINTGLRRREPLVHKVIASCGTPPNTLEDDAKAEVEFLADTKLKVVPPSPLGRRFGKLPGASARLPKFQDMSPKINGLKAKKRKLDH